MVQPAGDGVPLFWTSILMLVISYLAFVPRVGVRIWRKTLGWDDLLMFLGLLLFSVTASLCIVCCFLGSGQLSKVLSTHDIMQGTKLFFIAEFFYASGAVLIKSSIAVTLLRIDDSRRPIKYTIWAIMIATGVSAIVFIIGVANICHPITTLWGQTTTGTCDNKLNSDVSFFFSAIEIMTDWSLAIIPGILLWNLQMRKRVKFMLIIILGLAAFDPSEFMFSTGKIGLWSVIEEGIGIFAGSLPALRPLLSLSCLGRSQNGLSSGNGGAGTGSTKQSRRRNQLLDSDVHMEAFQQRRNRDGDGDSQQHILKETEVAVTARDNSRTRGEWERTQVLGWKR
ncbi:hypothetical protein UA08_07739 [Talaromyces atroroseus]|uniref:Rhodopsin domain-containing protein n=1 Tax=Talaromyces atroroseus TaxID=1441469 RepID=A0A225AFR0_TALAT|nr:hypothetical protein UA08_07739 [Talaromyces atroroseus]OKL56914.1 hypothetical protein UA08_07739 [Talaromyces atroroseus]